MGHTCIASSNIDIIHATDNQYIFAGSLTGEAQAVVSLSNKNANIWKALETLEQTYHINPLSVEIMVENKSSEFQNQTDIEVNEDDVVLGQSIFIATTGNTNVPDIFENSETTKELPDQEQPLAQPIKTFDEPLR